MLVPVPHPIILNESGRKDSERDSERASILMILLNIKWFWRKLWIQSGSICNTIYVPFPHFPNLNEEKNNELCCAFVLLLSQHKLFYYSQQARIVSIRKEREEKFAWWLHIPRWWRCGSINCDRYGCRSGNLPSHNFYFYFYF